FRSLERCGCLTFVFFGGRQALVYGINNSLWVRSCLAHASGSRILIKHNAQDMERIDIGLTTFHREFCGGRDNVMGLLAQQPVEDDGTYLASSALSMKIASKKFVEGVAVGTGGAEESGHYVLLVGCTSEVHQRLSVSNSSNRS